MGPTSIVLLTVDSLRYDSIYTEDGVVREELTTIKEFAEQGTNFHDAWATAPFTRGSFPAILTGCFQWSSFAGGETLSTDKPYLPDAMHEAGFTTGGFHSNPHLDERFGWGRGFDHYFTGGFEESDTNLKGRLQEIITNSKYTEKAARKILSTMGKISGVDIRGKPYISAETLNRYAIEWLSDVDSPVFLWIHYMDVHNPWYPEEGTISSEIDKKALIKGYYQAKDSDEELDEQTAEQLQMAYKGSVQKFDTDLGRFLEELSEHLEDPMIWLTSDHGELLGDDGKWLHPPGVEKKLLHIPLIINSTISEPENQSPVSTVDIAPTILDAISCPIQETMDGRSLLQTNPERKVFAESGHASGGSIRVIGDKNEKFPVENLEALPEKARSEAEKILETRSESRSEIDDADLQEQLEALGYK